jgi:hypothetical protein
MNLFLFKKLIFLTNVIKVPGGTNSTLNSPKIYCLFIIITGNRYETTTYSGISLRNGGEYHHHHHVQKGLGEFPVP